MRRFGLLVVVVIALPLGCGSDPAEVVSSQADGLQYSISTTVLESPEHGPELCVGGIAESYPPQCGGPPIVGWSWDEVEDEESANGTTWGEYALVGTYDGGSFSLTGRPGPPVPPERRSDHFTSPCPEPDRGWRVLDHELFGSDASEAASRYARSQPTFAGHWVDPTINPKWRPGPYSYDEATAMELGDPAKQVLNFRFTGEVERHRSKLRELWGGPLCVSEAELTLAELTKLEETVRAELEDDGVLILFSSVDEVHGVVGIGLLVPDDELQKRFDGAFGEGVVEIDSAMKPVELSRR